MVHHLTSDICVMALMALRHQLKVEFAGCPHLGVYHCYTMSSSKKSSSNFSFVMLLNNNGWLDLYIQSTTRSNIIQHPYGHAHVCFPLSTIELMDWMDHRITIIMKGGIKSRLYLGCAKSSSALQALDLGSLDYSSAWRNK